MNATALKALQSTSEGRLFLAQFLPMSQRHPGKSMLVFSASTDRGSAVLWKRLVKSGLISLSEENRFHKFFVSLTPAGEALAKEVQS